MSIQSEIERLTGAKNDIATSIENQGVTVPSDALLSDMSSLIDQISGDVTSVNGQTGDVVLGAADVGALASDVTYVESINGSSGAVTIVVPSGASEVPQDLGVAAVGSSSNWARADHVHTMPSAEDVGAYIKPADGIPSSDLAAGVIPLVPGASSTTPIMDGVASVGTEDSWARGDHVHSTDISRAASDLGITGASVDDFVKIAAVDANGKPTAFSKGMPGGGDVTADMLGIVIDGNSTPVGASKGQYVIVKDSTISGITDGLYTAAQAIPANTAISSEYLTVVSNGGFNSLESGLNSLSTELSTKLGKFGKTLYSGNFSGSGNISVPGIFDYALVGVFPTGGSTYMMIGSPTRGGLAYGTYNSTGVSHFAYRFDYVNDNTIAVNSLNRGITDGTNTTYSGHADCKIKKIIGLIPNS